MQPPYNLVRDIPAPGACTGRFPVIHRELSAMWPSGGCWTIAVQDLEGEPEEFWITKLYVSQDDGDDPLRPLNWRRARRVERISYEDAS
jgi:hypothetical protein